MNSVRFEHPDGERSRLRAIVATIDREILHLSTPAANADGSSIYELTGSWAELITLLALGPVPEVRTCPVCGQLGMRAASRCGYCWTKLQPPLPD